MRRRSYASEGSRTKCARRDRKVPRESVTRKDFFTMGSDPIVKKIDGEEA